MSRRTYWAVAVVVFAGIAIYLAKSILHDGLSSQATPTKLETMLARNARHLAIPSAARATKNPVASSPEVLREARLHYADHCATCHGNDGRGDTSFGRGMYPKPPDLRREETQKLADGELFWIVENGVRFTGMPAFSGHGTQDASWKLIHFIRHIPQLTDEEKMEMGRYNPKGREDREEEQQEDDFLMGNKPKDAQDTKDLHHHDH